MGYKPLYTRTHALFVNPKSPLVQGGAQRRKNKSSAKEASKDDAFTGKELTSDLIYDANKDKSKYTTEQEQSDTEGADLRKLIDDMLENGAFGAGLGVEEKYKFSPEAEDTKWKIYVKIPSDSNNPTEIEQPLYYFHLQSVTPSVTTRLIQHPMEDGTVRIDNKVTDPRHLDITGLVPETVYHDNFEENIVDKYKDYFIRLAETKSSEAYVSVFLGQIYGEEKKNYQVTRFSSKASVEKIGMFEFSISLQELMLTNSKKTTVIKPDDSDSKNIGGQ